MYKAELLGNTVHQVAPNSNNGVLNNETVFVPLKYPSNLWSSLEMPLINCEVELTFR